MLYAISVKPMFMNIAWKVRNSNLLFYAQRLVIFTVSSLNSDFNMFLSAKQWILFYFIILIEPKLVDNNPFLAV